MVEPLLFGIVMGMMAVSLAGLFVAAYLQYLRGQDTQSLILKCAKRVFLFSLCYQLDLITPGKRPSCAISRKTCLDKPKSR